MIKIFSLIVIGIALLWLQMLLNPNGYNYGGFFLLAVAVAYFNEVKSIHAGVFKLEKYERIANHIDESIVSNYQILLNVTFNQQKTSFGPACALFVNYDDLKIIFEDIAKLPKNLKIKLNNDIKEYARKSAYLQKSYLEGHPYRITQKDKVLLSISEIEIPDIVKNKPDYTKAVEAYNYLVNIAQNGINS